MVWSDKVAARLGREATGPRSAAGEDAVGARTLDDLQRRTFADLLDPSAPTEALVTTTRGFQGGEAVEGFDDEAIESILSDD